VPGISKFYETRDSLVRSPIRKLNVRRRGAQTVAHADDSYIPICSNGGKVISQKIPPRGQWQDQKRTVEFQFSELSEVAASGAQAAWPAPHRSAVVYFRVPFGDTDGRRIRRQPLNLCGHGLSGRLFRALYGMPRSALAVVPIGAPIVGRSVGNL
jgi:hypothetical protein